MNRIIRKFTPAFCLGLMILWGWGWPVTRAGAQPYMIGDAFSLSTNAHADNTLDLGTFTPNDGLALFPYYFRIQLPVKNLTAWGVSIYTQNNPLHAWISPNGVYGGLRGTTDPTQGIPLYWQVYDRLQDAQGNWGTAASVTLTAENLRFYPDALKYWGRLLDSSDEDVVQNWASADVVQRRTLAGYKGLGDFPKAGRSLQTSEFYLYLGMDLGRVTQTQTFGATLNLDLYNLGIGITSGGYATPNPFFPARGQKTKLNFFLKNNASTVKILIYNLRGHRIKTLENTQEWDGRDDSGRLVEGGLYLYQVEAEGERVSGTVTLIK